MAGDNQLDILLIKAGWAGHSINRSWSISFSFLFFDCFLDVVAVVFVDISCNGANQWSFSWTDVDIGGFWLIVPIVLYIVVVVILYCCCCVSCDCLKTFFLNKMSYGHFLNFLIWLVSNTWRATTCISKWKKLKEYGIWLGIYIEYGLTISIHSRQKICRASLFSIIGPILRFEFQK